MCACPEGINNYSYDNATSFLSLYMTLGVNMMDRSGLSSKACFDAVFTSEKGFQGLYLATRQSFSIKGDWAYTYITESLKFG